MLQEKNLGTFGHMITNAYQLLKDNPALTDEMRRRTRFLLVDEFQDANYAQVEILSLLAGSKPDDSKPEGSVQNVFAVGDPDQAIYQFRGASSEAFTLFANKFPEAQIVVLGKNRRSLGNILGCAFGIVNDNPPVFEQTSAPKGPAMSYQRTPLESLRDEEAKQKGETAAGPLVEIVTWGNKEGEACLLYTSRCV